MKSTITITFGDCAENHVGMEKIGESVSEGFSLKELKRAQRKMEKLGAECELLYLNDAIDVDADDAYLLVIRDGVNIILSDISKSSDDMHEELNSFDWDTQAIMYGRLVNKHARHNVCFGEKSRKPDLENGKGTIVSFKRLECMNYLRSVFPDFLGKKANNLVAEGNLYYDVSKCGIGFHGDAERNVVIAMRIGETMPFHYQWFCDGEPIGDRIKLSINDGDIYVMSSKAVGTDWKRRKIPTLRHAAGSKKFLEIK